MAQPRRRNSKGQFIKKYISATVQKDLQDIAKEVEIRVKPLIRDELESVYRRKVYESYTPSTPYGEKINEYNETHARKKKARYHHTGLLARSIKALIDGDNIYIDIDRKVYDNGKTTIDVHEFLRNGTTSNPKKDIYGYKGKGGRHYLCSILPNT